MVRRSYPADGLGRDVSRRWERVERRMDFDQLVIRFFGTDDIGSLPPDQLVAGVERLRLQFGLEKDGGRCFALWCLLYTLGVTPGLDSAFDEEDDRNAARDFMDVADREMGDGG
ncbi:hypothetical protein ACBY01_15370 [Sphingomonas sp. ac-8]|uniref:hypothetical protein n=1 Tax=Sphingomonas sp. ac-8 TaxID=3242977 RepID=UPI003A8027F7